MSNESLTAYCGINWYHQEVNIPTDMNYDSCTFSHCQIKISASKAVRFHNCHFLNCNITIDKSGILFTSILETISFIGGCMIENVTIHGSVKTIISTAGYDSLTYDLDELHHINVAPAQLKMMVSDDKPVRSSELSGNIHVVLGICDNDILMNRIRAGNKYNPHAIAIIPPDYEDREDIIYVLTDSNNRYRVYYRGLIYYLNTLSLIMIGERRKLLRHVVQVANEISRNQCKK